MYAAYGTSLGHLTSEACPQLQNTYKLPTKTSVAVLDNLIHCLTVLMHEVSEQHKNTSHPIAYLCVHCLAVSSYLFLSVL